MARNGADVLSKKNSKLEAFLRRNLDLDSVERIRATESCIVCSEREDKAFKYVVLSDEWLYLKQLSFLQHFASLFKNIDLCIVGFTVRDLIPNIICNLMYSVFAVE